MRKGILLLIPAAWWGLKAGREHLRLSEGEYMFSHTL